MAKQNDVMRKQIMTLQIDRRILWFCKDEFDILYPKERRAPLCGGVWV